MKKILSLLLALTALTLLSACSKKAEPVTDRLFEEEAFSITLTSQYERQTTEDGVLFVSEHASVHVATVSKAALADSSLSPHCTRAQWVEAYRTVNFPDAALEEEEGLLSLSAMPAGEGEASRRFRTFFFEKDDAMLLLTFSADAVSFPSMNPSFLSFAKSFQIQ